MKAGWLILAFVLGIAAGLWGAGYYYENRPISPMKPQVDTLIIRDTCVREKPVFVAKKVVDTIYIAYRDTLLQVDSILVPIPIEEKVYEDSLYRAVVSGFCPSLDTISIYQRTAYIEKLVEVKMQPRLSVGVQAGAGLAAGSSIQLAPYIGIGIQYNLLNFWYKQ